MGDYFSANQGWTGDTIAQPVINPPPATNSLYSRTGPGVTQPGAQGNIAAAGGLASRDPAYLQQLANRIAPGAPMQQGGGQIPQWLPPAMNSLANLPYGGWGGGVGGQMQQPPMIMQQGPQVDPANLLRQQMLQRSLGSLNWAQNRMTPTPAQQGETTSLQNQVSLLAGQPLNTSGSGWGAPQSYAGRNPSIWPTGSIF